MDLQPSFWAWSPLVRGLGPCVMPPPPRLQFPLLKLLRSICVACVLALLGWSVVHLTREVRRQLVFTYVDAALDGGVYRLGGLKHALHTFDGHFLWSPNQKKKFRKLQVWSRPTLKNSSTTCAPPHSLM